MPIAALSEYYEFQKRTGRLQTTDAYSSVKISYLICLTPEGTLADILCHKKTVELGNGKTKDISTAEIFPRRIEIPAIRANVIEHRPAYIFGLYYDPKEKVLVTDGDKDKAKKSHEAFIEKQQEFLGDLDTPLARAVLRFTETWNPARECENPHLLGIAKELGTSGFAFCLAGAPSTLLNAEEAVRQKWETAYHAEDPGADENVLAQCAVSGKPAPIARLHNNLKGIRGGQTSGVNLVCFKESAYESYGKTQSYNSNISETVMEQYTAAFNSLAADKRHKQEFGEMTVLYWSADEAESDALDAFNLLAFGESAGLESEELDIELDNIMNYAARGVYLSLDRKGISPNTKFYTLGVMPNASRLAVRFFTQQRFGDLMKNIAQHQVDLAIDSGQKPVFLYSMMKELKSPKATKEKIPSPFTTQVLRAVMEGTPYPYELLYRTVTRVKIDSDDKEKGSFFKLNRIRAGIIKACLNRKNRWNNKKEEFTMGLDVTNQSPAYLCGRLFAVLEKIQKDAAPSLNKTIKDTYFAAACATPAAVFARLTKLSNYHLAKFKEPAKIYYNNMVGQIVNDLSGEFPKTLNLEDQGRFIVGYYQQNKVLYTATENTDNKKTEEGQEHGSN